MNWTIAVTDIEQFLAGQPVKVQLPTEQVPLGSFKVAFSGDVTIQKVA